MKGCPFKPCDTSLSILLAPSLGLLPAENHAKSLAAGRDSKRSASSRCFTSMSGGLHGCHTSPGANLPQTKFRQPSMAGRWLGLQFFTHFPRWFHIIPHPNKPPGLSFRHPKWGPGDFIGWSKNSKSRIGKRNAAPGPTGPFFGNRIFFAQFMTFFLTKFHRFL